MSIDQLETFEKTNNISVNVFRYNADNQTKGLKDIITPIYKTQHFWEFNPDGTDLKHVNLLFLDNPTKADESHYVVIQKLSARDQYSTNHKEKTHFCNGCLHYYSSDKVLKAHLPLKGVNCDNSPISDVIEKFPNEKESQIKFKNFQRKLRLPSVLAVDFESITPK